MQGVVINSLIETYENESSCKRACCRSAESVGVEPTLDFRPASLANLCHTVRLTLQACFIIAFLTANR